MAVNASILEEIGNGKRNEYQMLYIIEKIGQINLKNSTASDEKLLFLDIINLLKKKLACFYAVKVLINKICRKLKLDDYLYFKK